VELSIGLGSVVATIAVDVSPPQQHGNAQPLRQRLQEYQEWIGPALLNVGGMGLVGVGRLAGAADNSAGSEILVVGVELVQLAVGPWASGRRLLEIHFCLPCT